MVIALLDAAHIYHALASAWLQREIGAGWAACPITQNGCIRTMSQPAYPGALAAADVAQRLGEVAAGPAHQFWPADIDLVQAGAADWQRVLGYRQVSVVYLLALAVHHGGRLVMFDRRITAAAVPGGKRRAAGGDRLSGAKNRGWCEWSAVLVLSERSTLLQSAGPQTPHLSRDTIGLSRPAARRDP